MITIQNFYKPFHFTEDVEFINISTDSDNEVICLVHAEIKVTDFEGETLTYYSELKLPFFKNKIKLYLAEEIKQYFNFLPNTNNSEAYQPIVVNLKIQEVDFNQTIVYDNKYINNIKYIEGKSPNNGINNFYQLTQNQSRLERVVLTASEEYALKMFLLSEESYIDVTYSVVRNNTETLLSENINSENSIYVISHRLVEFIDSIYVGDIISIICENFRKDFVIFPDTYEGVVIQYLNDFGLIDNYIFTGNYKLEENKTRTSFDSFRQFENYLENISSETTFTLRINSGFIIANNTTIIQSISNSRWIKCSLNFKNCLEQILYTLTPLSSKIITEDNERELIAYNLEFNLNIENTENTQFYPIPAHLDLENITQQNCEKQADLVINSENNGMVKLSFKIINGSLNFNGINYVEGIYTVEIMHYTLQQLLHFSLISFNNNLQASVIFKVINGSSTVVVTHSCNSQNAPVANLYWNVDEELENIFSNTSSYSSNLFLVATDLDNDIVSRKLERKLNNGTYIEHGQFMNDEYSISENAYGVYQYRAKITDSYSNVAYSNVLKLELRELYLSPVMCFLIPSSSSILIPSCNNFNLMSESIYIETNTSLGVGSQLYVDSTGSILLGIKFIKTIDQSISKMYSVDQNTGIVTTYIGICN